MHSMVSNDWSARPQFFVYSPYGYVGYDTWPGRPSLWDSINAAGFVETTYKVELIGM